MILVVEFILPESIHYAGNDTGYPRVSHLCRGIVDIVRKDMMDAQHEGYCRVLTLANTKKLNAISPNPTAVSVNESTSAIKFTLTLTSLS